MFGFLKRFFFTLRKKKHPAPSPHEIVEELWNADFSKPNRTHFDIKSETSYDAYLYRRTLGLGLKKAGCLAWVEAPEYRYGDQEINARFRLDSLGGYAAAGLLFRMVDEGTYYMALVSGKGYFRLDAVRNRMPFPLIGWTEVPAPEADASGLGEKGADQGAGPETVDLTVIAFGHHLVLVINGIWAAELNDPSIASGTLGFILASYEAAPRQAEDAPYTAQAFLESLSVDSRISRVEAAYKVWKDSAAIPAESRFRLAETFAAMGEPAPALIQLKRAWEQRPPVRPDQDREADHGPEPLPEVPPDFLPEVPPDFRPDRRTQRELLLAARLAFQLDLYGEAEEYIEASLAQGRETPEGREALTEKAKILYGEKKFAELRDYAEGALGLKENDPVLHTLLGHAAWSLEDYEKAAAAYDRAFELDGENGLLAKNAANVYEVLGRRDEALKRYLAAGRIFLNQENYTDLGLLAPKLLSLGADDWEAHALAGKWAYGIEDWAMAEAEFITAEKQRTARRPRPPRDPAVSFLRGLLLIRQGKRREAFPFLEEAARFAPDFGLFHFRLAENRYLLSGNPKDPRLSMDLETALRLMPDDGWVHNFAAQVCLDRGDTDKASAHLEKAAASLGEAPAIRVNRGVLYYLRGSLDEALRILEAEDQDDPEGLLANNAGNLLVRSGEYERADEYYRKALARAPDNMEYLSNRASCLIKLGYYGQADELLAQAHSRAPSPEILELISYVAAKKGEFSRAESASLAALDMDGGYAPSLLSLGWLYCSAGRWEEAQAIILRLEALGPEGEAAERVKDLRRRLEEGTTRLITCASCERNWRVPRNPSPSPPLRLYAMPPDEFPAGTCPSCGAAYCIGCAKEHLDASGRYLCPGCGKTLKLIDEGLKKIVAGWAAAAITGSPEKNQQAVQTKSPGMLKEI
ncbi:MAG: tetratricopeptide repeat protein [Treponema sp.]|jgi:tetratricopeptide (TPR) repeat protein|nr:tetratricopeptide repeat protein [Treponema sp.]